MTNFAQIEHVNVYDGLARHLIGHRVVEATGNTLYLDNGATLEFQEHNDDCCSTVELDKLATTDHVITSMTVEDNENETGGEGAYRAWIHVITEAGELNIAEADGNASNGYYLHGFALRVTVTQPHLVQEEP